MKLHIIPLLFMIELFFSCTSIPEIENASQPPILSDKSTAFNDFLNNPFKNKEKPIVSADNVGVIQKVLGTPIEVKKRPVKNKHNNQITDYIYEFIYPNFTAFYYKVPDRFLLAYIQFNSNIDINKRMEIIGESIDDMMKNIDNANPIYSDKKTIIFYPTEEDQIVFSLNAKKQIISVSLLYYLD